MLKGVESSKSGQSNHVALTAAAAVQAFSAELQLEGVTVQAEENWCETQYEKYMSCITRVDGKM